MEKKGSNKGSRNEHRTETNGEKMRQNMSFQVEEKSNKLSFILNSKWGKSIRRYNCRNIQAEYKNFAPVNVAASEFVH